MESAERVSANRRGHPQALNQGNDIVWPWTLVGPNYSIVCSELAGYRVEVLSEFFSDLLVKTGNERGCNQSSPSVDDFVKDAVHCI